MSILFMIFLGIKVLSFLLSQIINSKILVEYVQARNTHMNEDGSLMVVTQSLQIIDCALYFMHAVSHLQIYKYTHTYLRLKEKLYLQI